MRRQTGGSFTANNGTQYNSEEILDKFVGTYFDKSEISIDNSIYSLVHKLINIGGTENLKKYKLFMENNENRFFLEDSEINFEGIEKRIYATTSPIPEEKNMMGDAIFQVDSPTYIFKKPIVLPKKEDKSEQIQKIGNIYEAYHPSVFNTEGNKWVLRVKSKQNSQIIVTDISVDATSGEEAIFKITQGNTFVRSAPIYVSGFTPPNNKVPIEDVSEFKSLLKENKLCKKLIYEIDDDGRSRIFYAEPEDIEGKTWKFHPHNMWNFLPSSRYESKIKELFISISKKLSEECKNRHAYSIIPSVFYHIHLTKIPNEEYILLTIHGLYEELNSASMTYQTNLKTHTYKNTNKKYYKAKQINDFQGKINSINNPYNLKHSQIDSPDVEKIIEYRKNHNAYILLKPQTDKHSLYKLSENNQIGNPFLSVFENMLSMYPSFAIGADILGTALYDLNHIKGKGVMITMVNQECTIFCDKGNNPMREKILQKLSSFASPSATTEEIVGTEDGSWLKTIYGDQKDVNLPKIMKLKNLKKKTGKSEKKIKEIMEKNPGKSDEELIEMILTPVRDTRFQRLREIVPGNNANNDTLTDWIRFYNKATPGITAEEIAGFMAYDIPTNTSGGKRNRKTKKLRRQRQRRNKSRKV